MRAALDLSTVREQLGEGAARWPRLDYAEQVGSTNLVAREDPQPWRVVLADFQDSGRGRLTRSWQAPPRSSLAVSVVLPLRPRSSEWGWLPLLVGVAACDALRDVGLVRAGLKWPNDVVAPRPADERGQGSAGSAGSEGKVAGVLCESLVTSEGALAVAGAGINIDQHAQELAVPGAVSLRTLGLQVARERVLAAYLARLGELVSGWLDGGLDARAIGARYRERCATLGRDVEVSGVDGSIRSGRAVDVDGQGRIVLQTKDGRVALAAGDVRHLRPTTPGSSVPGTPARGTAPPGSSTPDSSTAGIPTPDASATGTATPDISTTGATPR